MTIPPEQLLNLKGIRVLSITDGESHIEFELESTQGSSICHKCGEKATEFYEHERPLTLRHLPVCGRPVILRIRPKRYRCLNCEGVVTTTERPD